MSKTPFLLLLLLIATLTAACSSAQPTALPTETPIPAVDLENATLSPLVSTPDQAVLQLSDPATDLAVAVSFDLPEGWEITGGLSNRRIILSITLQPSSGSGSTTPAEAVQNSVQQPVESVRINEREVFFAQGGSAPNAPLSLATTLEDRPYFVQITVLQVLEGTADDYRDALQKIIASAKVVE